MTDQNQVPQRILVALDGSPHSLAALQAAVTLARELEAELIGLFVEDVNLVRLARLPFTQEIQLTTARRQPLDSREMDQALRWQAKRLRRALQEAAAAANIPAQFKSVRGLVPAAVVAAALDADLLILGRFSRPRLRRRLGSTAQAALIQSSRSIMLTQQQLAPLRSILVTFDDSDLSWRALRQAFSLTQPEQALIILLLTTVPAEAEQWQARIERRLQAAGRQVGYRRLRQLTLNQLLQLVERENCDLLVMGSERLPVAAETAVSLLNQLDCSLMLIRNKIE